MRRSRLSNGGMPLLLPNQRSRLQTHQGCLHPNTAASSSPSKGMKRMRTEVFGTSDKENIVPTCRIRRSAAESPNRNHQQIGAVAQPPTGWTHLLSCHQNRTILEYSHNYPCQDIADYEILRSWPTLCLGSVPQLVEVRLRTVWCAVEGSRCSDDIKSGFSIRSRHAFHFVSYTHVVTAVDPFSFPSD